MRHSNWCTWPRLSGGPCNGGESLGSGELEAAGPACEGWGKVFLPEMTSSEKERDVSYLYILFPNACLVGK